MSLVKQREIESAIKLRPAACRKLLKNLERQGKIAVIRPNSRVKRYDLAEVMGALKSFGPSSTAMISSDQQTVGGK